MKFSQEALEQYVRQLVGKPFKDENGNIIGKVVAAWVDDGKVLTSVKFAKDIGAVEVPYRNVSLFSDETK